MKKKKEKAKSNIVVLQEARAIIGRVATALRDGTGAQQSWLVGYACGLLLSACCTLDLVMNTYDDAVENE